MMTAVLNLAPERKFLLLRHGESMANAGRTVAGFLDAPLTPLGRTQAEEIKPLIAALDERPNLVYHSALSRARDTASIVNQVIGCPMHEHPELAEQNYGDWQGQSWDVIDPFKAEDLDPPNGETKKQFYARAVAAVEYCLDHSAQIHRAPMPLIVCHGGIFNALRDYYGLPKQGHGNCALARIEKIGQAGSVNWTDLNNPSYSRL